MSHRRPVVIATVGALLAAACGVLPTVAHLPPAKVALSVPAGKGAVPAHIDGEWRRLR